jgi:apolipoprotein N-acyltransferase
VGFIAAGALLFGLSQPNGAIVKGVPVLAYIAYVPVFLMVRRLKWKTVWVAGLVYGVAAYCFFCYWLATFQPLGIFEIAGLYGVWLLVVFPLLKACVTLFPRRGWIAQWIVWVAYEYIKTLGWLGDPYGITAYSQWRVYPLIQMADVTGVWGVSAIVVFTSAWLSNVIWEAWQGEGAPQLKKSAAAHKISGFVWLGCFAAAMIYGVVSPVDYSKAPLTRVALVQQNTDPWKPDDPDTEPLTWYRHDFNTLSRLSSQAIEEGKAAGKPVELVVWPETSFIPWITWHWEHRTDPGSFALVSDLLNYLNIQSCPFVIGNDHAVDGYTRDGDRNWGILDYNAVLLFESGKNVIPPKPEIYAKMHLVPFTEWFPYDKMFPKLYQALLNGDTHMWVPGTEPHVFHASGLAFGSPVCFEDTFGYIGRQFVRNGARALVNLSNDAWSKSLACQYQHLSMALFRAVENRVPLVQATASGQTAYVDPNGRVRAMAKPFAEDYVAVDVPAFKELPRRTLYTRFGDWCGALFLLLTAGAFGLGIGLRIARKKR